MLEFTCSACRKLVQGDDAFAGNQVLCSACSAAATARPTPQLGDSPTEAIATPEHAPSAKIAMPSTSAAGAFREGEPPPMPRDDLPSIRKEVPSILARMAPLLVAVVIIGVLVGLLVPAVRMWNDAWSRTQSNNNLKQIGLAFHNFDSAFNYLPCNGEYAVAGKADAGCWAIPILSYVENQTLVFMCPGRGRPTVSTTGLWSDYFINTWINDPIAGAVNAADRKCKFKDITDGMSSTILVGHGTIDPTLYSSSVVIAQSTELSKGGNPGTARRVATNQRDTAGDTTLTWGGPFRGGALMAYCDGHVDVFSYDAGNGIMPFLTPAAGDNP